MAGDWFMFDTEHYEPYERVREYSQVEHFNYGVVYGNSGCIAFCEDAQSYNGRKYEKVMPIPLTEEILKANGINIFSNCDLSLPLYTMGIKVVERGVYIKMRFKFVHELQHALRLCGLKELADNFKITD